MSLGEGKEARGEPASRYKAQNWTPRAPGPTLEAPLPRQGPLLPASLSATGAETEKFPHAPLWILNNNKKTPPQRPREPVPRPSPHGVPGPAPLTCGLRRGAAPHGRGAGQQQSRQQQQQQQQCGAAAPGGGGAEESPGFALCRHLCPASGGGGGGDSAAERSRPSLSAPQPVSAP